MRIGSPARLGPQQLVTRSKVEAEDLKRAKAWEKVTSTKYLVRTDVCCGANVILTERLARHAESAHVYCVRRHCTRNFARPIADLDVLIVG